MRPVRRRTQLIVSLSCLLLAVIVTASAFLVASCVAPWSDAGPYVLLLDSLPVPSSWQLVHTTVRSFGGGDRQRDLSRPSDHLGCDRFFIAPCPMVERYYLVQGETQAIFDDGVQMLVRAGLPVTLFAGPCAAPNEALTDGCAVYAYPDAEKDVAVNVWPDSAFLDKALTGPGWSLVWVRAEFNTWGRRPPTSPQPTVRR